MLDLPEMNGQTRSPKLEQHFPLLMFPAHRPRLLQRLDTLATLCGDEIFLTTPSSARFLRFPQRNWPFPSYLLWTISTLLPWSQLSIVLLPMQDKMKKNSSCSTSRHLLQDLTHLLLDCPASEPLRRAIFGTTFSIYDLWSKLWGMARLLDHCGVPPCPHPSEGVG